MRLIQKLQFDTLFWKRYGRRLVLSAVLPLAVLAGVFGIAYWQLGSEDGQTTNPTLRQSQPHSQKQQPISTPNGVRYATVDAIAALDHARTLSQAHAIVQGFLDQYNLQLHTMSVAASSYVQEHDSFAVLEESDLNAFRAYVKIFVDEWAKYPRDWVDASHLKHIMIVKNLAVGDTERAATPDPIGDAMYYDVGYGAGLYAREVVHHEYNHQIEYKRFNSYSRADNQWAAFNPPGFSYNPRGGVAAYHEDGFRNDSHPQNGFVNRYAMYAIEEDKAETYAYLMTRDYAHELRGWMRTDVMLAKKVQLYKDFIKQVSPTMNDAYFTAINP